MGRHHAQDLHSPRFPIYLNLSDATAIRISSGKLASRIGYPLPLIIYLRPAVTSTQDSDVVGQGIHHHSTNGHALLGVAFEVDIPLTSFQILRVGLQHPRGHLKELSFGIGRGLSNCSSGDQRSRLGISSLIEGANAGIR